MNQNFHFGFELFKPKLEVSNKLLGLYKLLLLLLEVVVIPLLPTFYTNNYY